jgi:hypothetical protein
MDSLFSRLYSLLLRNIFPVLTRRPSASQSGLCGAFSSSKKSVRHFRRLGARSSVSAVKKSGCSEARARISTVSLQSRIFNFPICQARDSVRTHGDGFENIAQENQFVSIHRKSLSGCRAALLSPLQNGNAHHGNANKSGAAKCARADCIAGDVQGVMRNASKQGRHHYGCRDTETEKESPLHFSKIGFAAKGCYRPLFMDA